MTTHEVGKPYPHHNHARGIDESRISFNEAFLDVFFYSTQPTQDAKGWGKDALSIYLYQEKNIPFLIFNFPEYNFDVSLNIHKVQTDNFNSKQYR